MKPAAHAAGHGDETVVWPDDAVEVGRIAAAWGVQGGFKILPFSAQPQALFSARRWYLQPATARPSSTGGPVAGAGLPVQLKVTFCRAHGPWVVAKAQGVADRSAAERLKGARVFVSRRSFPTAAPDEYYWVDLIGLNVVNRNGVWLGIVADLIDTGPHCVLRVHAAETGTSTPLSQAERLIPFVSAYVDEVDLQQRRITVEWELDY